MDAKDKAFEKIKALVETNGEENVKLAYELAKGTKQQKRFYKWIAKEWQDLIRVVAKDRQKGKKCHSFVEGEMQWENAADVTGCLVELQGLKYLNLDYASVVSLPEQFGELSNLIGLHLSNNGLTSLPKSVYKLDKLEYLGLGNNKISSLSEDISGLCNLTELYLNNNELTSLPQSILNLSKIEILDARNNKLETIPKEVEKGGLVDFYLKGNPIAKDQAKIQALKKQLPDCNIVY